MRALDNRPVPGAHSALPPTLIIHGCQGGPGRNGGTDKTRYPDLFIRRNMKERSYSVLAVCCLAGPEVPACSL